MKIGVVGLGKLGLPLALTYAQRNGAVYAYDHDPEVRDRVIQKMHHDEPIVDEMLHTYTLHVTTAKEVGTYADIIFVVVPTPSKDDGTFSDKHIRDVITSLPAKPPNDTPTVIAVVSTVSPGAFTGESSLSALAHKHGHRLVYVPTLIALGSVVHDLIYPDVQMIGVDTSDTATLNITSTAMRSITDSQFVFTDHESAALAKLASNVFVTMKIGFANVLAQLCDQLGGDVEDVTKILGLNKRIGEKSLVAGAGYGGPCFPRDAVAFTAIAPESIAGGLGRMAQRMNDEHLDYVVGKACEWGDTYAVLGREYKEGSEYVIESFGNRIAYELDELMTATSADAADVVVVAQPLRHVNLRELVKPGAYVYDLWRTHGYLAERKDITYVQLGTREGRNA